MTARIQSIRPTRRAFLAGASLLALNPPLFARTAVTNVKAVPVPTGFVQLKPSIFADHVEANRRYLLALDPDRLLHNFHKFAGLSPKGERYGGWESAGIAGHTLGHWLSACSILLGSRPDPALAAKLDHALAELARVQAAHGDSYIGGTMVDRDGQQVDGKIIFEELRRGDIRTQGFDLNGGWVPIYTWHKVQAGLIDAHRLAGNPRALPILLGMADYLATIVEGLSDEQVQTMLRAEHGGINEAFAETYAITGDRRWLNVAERLRHKAVLDPLTEQRDILPGLHANTQIPKLIGLARLHELTGDPAHAAAARFFHKTVTGSHSYVIGGNSEREHFGPPGKLDDRLSNATCEACNSYNMMKLTRHLFAWQPSSDLFDYYERVQLNHMLAHHRPDDGRFAYFIPLSAGDKRTYSTPEGDFWCCVGSGMESAAKHADSIYWTDASTLYVNLFIASSLDLAERGLALDLDTDFPASGAVELTIRKAPRRAIAIAIRLPAWADDPQVLVAGRPAAFERRSGYAVLNRRWRAGDRISLSLPMRLRSESIAGDASIVAFLSGPLVLAADLGPASSEYHRGAPALIAEGEPVSALTRRGPHEFAAQSVLGEPLTLRPMTPLYDRRTAVYLKAFSPESWAAERPAYLAGEAVRAELARRTIDLFHIGEQQPEIDHGFRSTKSEVGHFYGKISRNLPQGESMSFRIARRPGPSSLQLTYVWWETDREVEIQVDGETVAVERLPRSPTDDWVVVDYPLPPTVEPSSEAKIVARKGGIQIFGVRVMSASAAQA
jgi:DUF1680 family protein